MSATPACIVRCDLTGCEAEYLSRGSDLPMLARSDAQATGWEITSRPGSSGRTDVTDRCPAHASVAARQRGRLTCPVRPCHPRRVVPRRPGEPCDPKRGSPGTARTKIATMESMRRFWAPGVSAYSPATGEKRCANPADYWYLTNADGPLTDSEGEPMILVTRSVRMVGVR